jgi:glutaredoxin
VVKVTLYTRAGCHLCEEAKHVLQQGRLQTAFELEEVDIDADPDLRRQFHEEVPVIFINGRKAFKYHVDPGELARRLRTW